MTAQEHWREFMVRMQSEAPDEVPDGDAVAELAEYDALAATHPDDDGMTLGIRVNEWLRERRGWGGMGMVALGGGGGLMANAEYLDQRDGEAEADCLQWEGQRKPDFLR